MGYLFKHQMSNDNKPDRHLFPHSNKKNVLTTIKCTSAQSTFLRKKIEYGCSVSKTKTIAS
jgi:hypothetical protein